MNVYIYIYIYEAAAFRNIAQEFAESESEEARERILARLPGMSWESTGYCRKNLSLFLSDLFEGHGRSVSGGGSGALRGYSYEVYGRRLGNLTKSDMAVLVTRDLQMARAQWTQQKFGARAWELLTDREAEVRALDVTAWRCAIDKFMWRHVLRVNPPQAFATWRAYFKHKRALPGNEV